MHDFFARQDQARRSTTLLLVYFALAVMLLILAVYLTARGLLLYTSTEFVTLPSRPGWWNLEWFLWTSGSTAAIILAGTFYQISQLRSGGRRIAEMLDGRRVVPGTNDPRERQLLNIVEEIAIAAGIPVPDLYLLERERGINAFASGFNVNDGVVCVTRGALELLNREELQGVVAHEFSHLLNGDTLINLRLVSWLYGILMLNQIGAGLLRTMSYDRRSRGNGPFMVLGLALWLLGSLGYFCGQLIKSAVSRQREHLADASAVQFTRNPLGLAGALKKIGGLDQGSLLRHPQAALASHMYFGEGIRRSWLAALATHPPLAERIRLLDPTFDGRYPAVTPLPAPEPQPGYVQRPAAMPGVATLNGAAVMALFERIGTLEEGHLQAARSQLQALPPSLRSATESPLEAAALLCGLLLQQDQGRRKQLQLLEAAPLPGLAQAVNCLQPQLEQLEQETRLLLVDLLLPSLRSLSAGQYRQLRRLLQQLIDADRKTSLFEYAVLQLVVGSLDRQFNGGRRPVVQYYVMRAVEDEAALVLSLLARVGQDEAEAVSTAFAQGARVLAEPRLRLRLLEQQECDRLQLDQALVKLKQVSPQLKQKLLAGCLQTLLADETIQAAELELFRALAASLEVPVPPWLTPGS